MKRLKLFALTLLTICNIGLITAAVPVYAETASKSSACDALNQLDADQGCGNDDSGNVVTRLVKTIVNILSLVLGAVAVIMIIVAGFKYTTSGGDSNSIAGAKNTLIYAIVGLVVAALAQFIVRFVLAKV